MRNPATNETVAAATACDRESVLSDLRLRFLAGVRFLLRHHERDECHAEAILEEMAVRISCGECDRSNLARTLLLITREWIERLPVIPAQSRHEILDSGRNDAVVLGQWRAGRIHVPDVRSYLAHRLLRKSA